MKCSVCHKRMPEKEGKEFADKLARAALIVFGPLDKQDPKLTYSMYSSVHKTVLDNALCERCIEDDGSDVMDYAAALVAAFPLFEVKVRTRGEGEGCSD